MSRPPIQTIELNKYMTLCECHPDSGCRQVNWWLYDERAGMNIVMRALTREDALVEASEYWAERCQSMEGGYRKLQKLVDQFVETVRPLEDEES